MKPADRLLRRIRVLVGVFMMGLVVSGLTAIPLEWEMNTTIRLLSLDAPSSRLAPTGFGRWLLRVREAVLDTNQRHPFMSYGTDPGPRFGGRLVAVPDGSWLAGARVSARRMMPSREDVPPTGRTGSPAWRGAPCHSRAP